MLTDLVWVPRATVSSQECWSCRVQETTFHSILPILQLLCSFWPSSSMFPKLCMCVFEWVDIHILFMAEHSKLAYSPYFNRLWASALMADHCRDVSLAQTEAALTYGFRDKCWKASLTTCPLNNAATADSPVRSILKESLVRCWGDGLVGKALFVQAWGLKFGSSACSKIQVWWWTSVTQHGAGRRQAGPGRFSG